MKAVPGKELAPMIANGQLVPLVSHFWFQNLFQNLVSHFCSQNLVQHQHQHQHQNLDQHQPLIQLSRQLCWTWSRRQCWRIFLLQRFQHKSWWTNNDNMIFKGFLIDGYPRDIAQAEEFEKSISPCKQVIFRIDGNRCTVCKLPSILLEIVVQPQIIFFELSDETMTARLLQRFKPWIDIKIRKSRHRGRLKVIHEA